jgi:hypothetical protein
MRPSQTAAGLPDSRQPARDHCGESNSPSSIAPDGHHLGLPVPSYEEFLSRFGDTIDDRIAEILDELLTERNSARQHQRLPYLLGAVSLVFAALAVSVILRHSPIVWLIWPATAVVCVSSGLWVKSAS